MNSQTKQGVGKSEILSPPELQQPLAPLNHPNESTGGDVKQPLPSPFAPTDLHSKFSEDVHNYIREYIRNADQKAAFFFAATTALLAFLHSQNATGRWFKDVRSWSFVDALAFFAMVGLGSSACVLLAVVFPRLKGSRRGILFFNAIAEHDSSMEYADEVLHRSPQEIIRVKLQHSYDLAKVCTNKYRHLRVGFWIGSIGAGAALLFLVLGRAG